MSWKFSPFIIILLFSLIIPPATSHAHTTELFLTKIDTDGSVESSTPLALEDIAGGFSVATGDLGTDGVSEIILGQGPNNEPRVRTLRIDGSEIINFLAYGPELKSGINVAVCDFDGDGIEEIATAPQRSGGPHVKLFHGTGEPFNEGTFVYAKTYRDGVNITCGDLDNDGQAELVTLPAPGGGPHVRIWDFVENEFVLKKEFFAFSSDDKRGLVGTVHNNQLTIASQHNSVVEIISYDKTISPVEMKTVTLPISGITNIFFQNNELKLSSASDSNIYKIDGTKTTTVSSTFNAITTATVSLATQEEEMIVVVPAKPFFSERTEPQYIVVDRTHQRIFTYEYGVLERTFLVSTAKAPYVTPEGEHTVLAKPLWVNYVWSYGPNNPNNYDLGYQPFNLRIYPHIYIHYAPWHDNFGHPMSHGCINVDRENIEWIYNWAEVETPVTVI